MDKLQVTAHLRSPLIRGGYLTLDSILGARLFDELQDVDAAHAAIPIRNTRGLFHASAALTEGAMEPFTFIAALRETHRLDPDLIKKNKEGQLHTTFSSRYSNVLNAYQAQRAAHATWFVEGDGDAIQRLLEPVLFIGKRRSAGFGEVISWSFAPDDDSSDQYGIEGPLGEPLRPVPVSMFQGDKSHPVVDAAWRPAYWNPINRAACYAPLLG